MEMRQRASEAHSRVYDVTLQDCGPVASDTLFCSEVGVGLILTRNALRESLQVEGYQKLRSDGRKMAVKYGA